MANAKWNVIDQEQYGFEEHYCAFLDILGFKEHSKKFFDGSFNLYGRFKRALGKAASLNEQTKMFVNSDLLEVRFFSDSIVLSHPVNEQVEDAAFNILQMCKSLSVFLSFEGLFLRGAISRGRHFERYDEDLNASFLCSEALQEAYELESTQAIYPRILIHEKIVNDLSGMARKFVAKDLDHYFLHYFPQFVNSEGENLKDLIKECSDIYALFESSANLRVKEKYRWLLSYYYWTVSLIPGVDLTPFEKFKVGDCIHFRLLDR